MAGTALVCDNRKNMSLHRISSRLVLFLNAWESIQTQPADTIFQGEIPADNPDVAFDTWFAIGYFDWPATQVPDCGLRRPAGLPRGGGDPYSTSTQIRQSGFSVS